MSKALELDLRAVQAALGKRPFLHSSAVLGPTRDIFGVKDHGYRRIDDFTFLHVLNFRAIQSYRLTLARADLICVQIMISGTYSRWAKDRTDLVDAARIHLTNFPRSTSGIDAGVLLRGILIACERRHFLKRFGVNMDRIPIAYRPLFLSAQGMAQALQLPTQASTLISTEQILACRLEEPLRGIYLAAKVAEILCDVTARLNSLSPQHAPRGALLRPRSPTVDAAAAIYRRELHNPPTVEQLAFRVGLNRNDLTSGFRERYGLTPHAFSRAVRMAEAQKLLREERFSISEVARRVGYGGYASFSRAYHAHFGHAPTLEDRSEETG